MVGLRNRRGAVLIIVLGVLFILSLLATTFATLQGTEQQVAANYLDTVRAKLLAQSAIQDAEARLREHFPFRYFDTANVTAPKPWKFWGRDKTETVDPGYLERVEDAVNPSFAIEKENPQDPTDPRVEPQTIWIRKGGKRREVGLSGVQGGTYMRHGDHYVLKINDLSGRIYVNDGLDGGPQGSVSQNLKRMLNILGQIVQVPQLGDRILANRPPYGYRHPQELLKAVGYDEALWARFRDFVTVYAWVDPNVANPVPLSAAKLSDYPIQYYRGNPPIYRHGSYISGRDARGEAVQVPGGLNTCPNVCPGGNHDNPAIRIYGLDTLNPQWIEIVSRAPVNVNSAPLEVLVALLTDLKGFFVGDRRRNNPNWRGDKYLSFKHQSTYSPDRTDGDEYGFLMETVPIVGPGGTATDGISAYVIAEEIIACRSRRSSKNFNYATVPWSGPFKTWRQFYQFVDNLALPKSEGGAGVLEDPRPIHKDYAEEVPDPTGHGPLVDSPVQRRHAVRAIADVIKANFNPNLHLNELNPDENLYLRVDKTDLIVNSTEFCFVPTGYFEIEALGRIVRPVDPDQKDADAYLHDCEIVAQAKATATYKIYDLYRETSQKQFYAGELPPRSGSFETNNDYSLEIGPEPDNGVFPGNLGAPGEPDNEWDGYIAFPTVGGVFGGHGASRKSKNTLVSTLGLPNAPHLNAAMHGHFTLDFHLHHSTLDRSEIGSLEMGPDDPIENYGDVVHNQILSYGGPYAPTSGPGGAPPAGTPIHRLARSFRLNYNPMAGTVSAPGLMPYAPSDLRIDGGYVERHAAPAYFVQRGGAIWNFNQERATGMVSYWIKPSFFPELTGKVRAFWDMSRYHTPCGAQVHVWPFAQWFYPSNYQAGASGISENTGPKYSHNDCGQYQPCSIVWGTKQWHESSSGPLGGNSGNSGHSFGKISACLNHLGHDDCVKLNRLNPRAKPSPLRAHRWLHTTFSWNLMGGSDTSGLMYSKMYINGVASGPSSPYIPYTYTTMTGGWAEHYDRMNYFDKHDGGEYNQMRLGAPSRIAKAAVAGETGAFRGNFSGDHTVDELYVWKSEGEGDPLVLWQRGRYYKPLENAYGEGRFLSQPISLLPSLARLLPPPSTAVPPGMGGRVQDGSIQTANVQKVRVLGISWTWFAEDVDPETGRPQLFDYNDPTLGIAVDDVRPTLKLGIRDGQLTYGPFEDDAFSAVRAPDGTVPVLQDPRQVRYFAQFGLEGAQLQTILLATPVLDDVTLYYDDAGSHLLSYTFDNRIF